MHQSFRLGPDLVPIFLLSHVSKEADDFIALVQEAAESAAGVETICATSVKVG